MTDKPKARTKRVRPTGFLAGLTLFSTSILFFYDIFTGKFLFTERDLGPYFIPPRFLWVQSIKQWDFPLWTPYQFCGYPFFANPQHAILYPFNGLFFLLPFDVAFNAIIILHFFLGGLFTYFFLRDLRVHVTGSLISGLIFMLSGYLLSVHGLLACLLSVVWTPLVMMFFRRAMTSPGFKNEILAALFLTTSFFGGGVEIVYGNFLVLLLMAMFSPVPNSPVFNGQNQEWGKRRRIWLSVRSLFVISIIFLLLSAVQLIPFFELFNHSIRGKGISYYEATIWSLAPKDFLLFFLPDAYGYFVGTLGDAFGVDMKKYWANQCWLKTLYTGGLPFILASLFFLFGKGRRLYLSLMLLSLFLAMGKYNPLFPLVHGYLPFFDGIRYPVKFLYVFILVLSITAGLGFQRLAELSQEGEKRKLKNLLIVFSLASGLLLIFFALGHERISLFLRLRGIDYPHFNHLSVNLYHVKRFLFYLALFFLLMRIGYEVKWRGWAKVLLLVFLAADLFGNMGFYGKDKTLDYFRKTRALEIIDSDKGHYRIFSTAKTIARDTPILIAGATPLDILKGKHLPSMNVLYRLHDIWGIDVVRPRRGDDLYKAFTGTPSISATNLIHLYGARYIVSVTPIDETRGFELMYSRLEGLEGKEEDLLKKNTIKLYKNHSALPRGWLVEDFRILDPNQILSTLMTTEFHPEKEVLLEEEPKWEGGSSGPVPTDVATGSMQDRVQFISESNNRVHLRVRARQKALLVLNDTHFPGWKAFVDGKVKKIYRANYGFRAVPVDAGSHKVEFIYDPFSFKLGAVVTFLGIIGCLITRIWTRRGSRPPKSSGPQPTAV